MKIRSGFVSNSSSSSFIIIGTELTSRERDDLCAGHFPDDNQNVWVDTHQWLSEGKEFFKLLPEMIPHFPETQYYSWSFYKVVDKIDTDTGSYRIKPEHLGHEVLAIEADYNQPHDENGFIRRFVEE